MVPFCCVQKNEILTDILDIKGPLCHPLENPLICWGRAALQITGQCRYTRKNINTKNLRDRLKIDSYIANCCYCQSGSAHNDLARTFSSLKSGRCTLLYFSLPKCIFGNTDALTKVINENSDTNLYVLKSTYLLCSVYFLLYVLHSIL